MTDYATKADKLASANNETEYQTRLLELLRQNAAVNLDQVAIPSSPGRMGKIKHWLREKVWRLFKYQHEQVTRQHNAVHELQSAALEHGYDLLQKRVAELESRLAQVNPGHK